MRRALNWFVVLLSALFLLAGMALSGCSSGGGGPDMLEQPAPSGMLRPVRDEAELEEVLKRSLQNTVAGGVPAGPVSLPNATAGDFSGT